MNGSEVRLSKSTRSDAASWLIHAGIEAHRPVLDSVYVTVSEIRQLRTRAQALASQLASGDKPGNEPTEPR